MPVILDVYPQRKNQRIAAVAEICAAGRTNRRIGGEVYIRDQYTGELVSSTTNPVETKKRFITPDTPRKNPKRKKKKLNNLKEQSVPKVQTTSKIKKTVRKQTLNYSITASSFHASTELATKPADDNTSELKPTVLKVPARKRRISEDLDDQFLISRKRCSSSSQKPEPTFRSFFSTKEKDNTTMKTPLTKSPSLKSSRTNSVSENISLDLHTPDIDSEVPAAPTSSTLLKTVPSDNQDGLDVSTSLASKKIVSYDVENEETMKSDTVVSHPEGTPTPVYVGRFIAVEESKNDVAGLITQIIQLPCFQEKHERRLLMVLELSDSELINKLRNEDIKEFYLHELTPAIENYEKFLEDPSSFFDRNLGQFEAFFENGLVVQFPLPPKPEIFPSQIWQRMNLETMEALAIAAHQEEQRLLQQARLEHERKQQEIIRYVENAVRFQAAQMAAHQNTANLVAQLIGLQHETIQNYVHHFAQHTNLI